MKLEGLSLQQAPPISVPFRFFLAAPLFGILAALSIIWIGDESLISRWTPGTLAITHGLLLGFLTSIMFGAQMQMLPVLAGAVVSNPRQLSWIIQVAWIAGVLLLQLAFVKGGAWLFQLAVVLLGGAVLVFIGSSGAALYRATSNIASVPGMKLALIALLVTIAWGVYLGLGHSGLLVLQRPAGTNIHLMWGLLGWVGLLIVSVAYQVVPLFQITEAYPKWLTGNFAPGAFVLLLLRMILVLAQQHFESAAQQLTQYAIVLVDLLVSAGLVAFACITLQLQKKRKRKVKDSHQQFWRVACYGLIAAVLGWWGAYGMSDPALKELVLFISTVLFIACFVMPVVTGMLYKIVAFLIWFHLQGLNTDRMMAGKPAIKVPHMKAVIAEKQVKGQLRVLYPAMMITPLLIVWPQWLSIPAGLAWTAHFCVMLLNLVRAYRDYLEYAKAGAE